MPEGHHQLETLTKCYSSKSVNLTKFRFCIKILHTYLDNNCANQSTKIFNGIRYYTSYWNKKITPYNPANQSSSQMTLITHNHSQWTFIILRSNIIHLINLANSELKKFCWVMDCVFTFLNRALVKYNVPINYAPIQMPHSMSSRLLTIFIIGLVCSIFKAVERSKREWFVIIWGFTEIILVYNILKHSTFDEYSHIT